MQRVPNADPHRVVLAEMFDPYTLHLVRATNRFASDESSIDERWQSDDKFRFVCHAEEVVIHKVYRTGANPADYVLTTTYFPCARCANHIVMAGIRKVRAPAPDLQHHRWGKEWQAALQIFADGGVDVSHP